MGGIPTLYLNDQQPYARNDHNEIRGICRRPPARSRQLPRPAAAAGAQTPSSRPRSCRSVGDLVSFPPFVSPSRGRFFSIARGLGCPERATLPAAPRHPENFARPAADAPAKLYNHRRTRKRSGRLWREPTGTPLSAQRRPPLRAGLRRPAADRALVVRTSVWVRGGRLSPSVPISFARASLIWSGKSPSWNPRLFQCGVSRLVQRCITLFSRFVYPMLVTVAGRAWGSDVTFVCGRALRFASSCSGSLGLPSLRNDRLSSRRCTSAAWHFTKPVNMPKRSR